jgi:hypothetical protein
MSDTYLDDLYKYTYKLRESMKCFKAHKRVEVLTAGGKKEWAQAHQVLIENNLVHHKVRVSI